MAKRRLSPFRKTAVLDKLLGRLRVERLEDRTTPAVPFGVPNTLTSALGGAASVAAADLDGDGDLDVAAAGRGDGRVVWFENNGAGDFAAAKTVSVGTSYAWVTAADVTGDGRPDLLAADPAAGVALFRNLGGGAFAAPAAVSAAPGVIRVEVADFDGAGGLDLAVATDAGTFAWAAGAGDGTFGPVQLIAATAAGDVSLAAGDIDNDGKPDVVAGSAGAGTVTWHRNTGGGTFAAGVRVSSSAGRVSAVATADLDGDGDRDVLAADAAGGAVSWFAFAAGGFGPAQTVAFAPGASALAVADLDRDGDRDVLVGSTAGVGVAENADGRGAFGPLQAAAATGVPAALAAADLDGDADVDALVAGPGGAVQWLPNALTRNAELFGARNVIGTGVTRATYTVTADLDRDGDQDVIAVARGANSVVWFRNDGLGGFGAAQPLAVAYTAPGPVSVSAPFSVSVGDLDADGDADVVVRWTGGNAVSWHANRLNEASADFGPAQTIVSGLTAVRGPDVADLDGDGKLDVLAAGGSLANSNRVVWFKNLGGTFTGEQVIGANAAGPVNVFAADLDGDGKLDVLSSHSADTSLSWYKNLGGGTFAARQVLDGAAGVIFHLSTGDLDGDGDRDVVAVDQAPNANRILVYRNLGGGVLGPREVLTRFVTSPRSVQVADLEGDLDLDIVSVGQGGNKVAWYENVGGAFGTQEIISNVPSTGYSGTVADLDGDGDVDVVSASYDDDTVAWYRNDIVRRSERFPTQTVISSGLVNVTYTRAVDLDGDGDVDVAGVSRGNSTVVWFENDGTGTFGPARPIAAAFTLPGGGAVSAPFAVEFADFDGDGDKDAAVCWISGGNVISWHANRLNEATADFGPPQVVRSGAGLVGGTGPAPADLDGDGDIDLLAGATAPIAGNNRIVWYENQGAGVTWAERVVDAAAQGPQVVLSADFDGDGVVDILASHNTDKSIGWYRGLGGGTFGGRVVLATVPEAAPYTLTTADLDGDGRRDLVAGVLNSNYVAWYRNNGDGTVGPRQVISRILRSPREVTATDIDGDGDQDVVAFSQRANKVAWFENLGGGVFRRQQLVSNAPQGTFSGVVADLDGDGDPDLVSGDCSGGALVWYENRGGEFDLTAVVPPAAGSYLAGQSLDVRVTFNEAVAVNTAGGTPSVRLTIGASVVDALYVTGGGTPTLVFRYVVRPGDRDADGVALGGPIQLNGGTISGPGGAAAPRGFNPVAAPGVLVDGTVPAVLSVTRAAASPTAATDVAFTVVFSEPVTGVDAADFLPVAAGPGGAAVIGVTGIGTTYTVRLYTGTGDGTVGLSVRDDGTIVDADANPLGGAADGAFAGPAYAIDRTAPQLMSVTTSSPNPSRAAAVTFTVVFSEPVEGVDAADLLPVAAGGLTGAAVTRVVPAGDGRTFAVTVSTGTGAGTLRLDVRADGSVTDAANNTPAAPFTTGAAYAVDPTGPGPRFDTYLTEGHSDIRPTYRDGAWTLSVARAEGVSTVERYAPADILITVSEAGRGVQLAGPQWGFVGAGAGNPVWVIPRTVNPELPFFGLSGEDAVNGMFARYFEADPRVALANDWIKLSLVEVRGPAGGEFALYQVDDIGPRVWMATSDGVSAQDAVWFREGGHDHYNWSFTKPGVYEVDLRASGYLDANGNGQYDPGVDPFSESAVTTFYFSIAAPNAAPVVTAPASVATRSGVPVAIGGVALADPDTHPNPARLTLTATGGTVSLGAALGLTFLTGDGIADANVVVEGPLAALNAALAGLRFSPTSGFSGTAGVVVAVDDGGFYSPTNGRSASAAIAVAVAPPVLVPFARPAAVSTADSVNSSATADLDGDGDPDVLTAAGGDGQVLWTQNLGRGRFAAPVVIVTGLPDASAVAAADLDGDGDLDALAVNTGGRAVWVENLGGGRFADPREITDQLPGSYSITAADFDGDGDLDVVAGAGDDDTVAWFANRLNEPSHDFGPLRAVTTAADGVVNLEVADLNGDGRPDVVYLSANDNTVAWSKNLGGIFAPRQVISDAVAGAFWMTTADLDGDGDRDVIAAAFDDAQVVWFANDGAGNFGPSQLVAADVPRVSTVAVADVNGDGRPDVLAVGLNGLVTWSENLGGTFRPRQVIANRPGTLPVGVAAADLDGDGDADVLVSEYRGDRVSWFENRLGERVNELTPPAASTYLVGQVLEFSWYVGTNVTVDTAGGVPTLPLAIGTTLRQATFVAQPDPSTLVFRYTVQPGDVDADGIAVGPAVRLNGGTIRDVLGADAPLDLPAADTRPVRVDGNGPVVVRIVRADANPTAAGTVAFTVTFSEPVAGVDAADFAVTATGVTGAAVAGVSGGGTTWTVLVATGIGSGTVRLDVRADATVADLDGTTLGGGYTSGQVYTLNRAAEPRTISEYVTYEHLDLAPNYADGGWHLGWHVDREAGPVEYAPDGVLVVAGPVAWRDRPAGSAFDFLGVAAGESVWVLPQNQQPEVPYPGIGAEDTAADTFARYLESDPRVGTVAAWIRLGLVAVRGPAGGQFSLYQSTDTGPKVWMATADGVTAQDAVWTVPAGHAHFNWAFTRPGVYQIDVVASGFLDANGNGVYDAGIDPYTESGVTTYYFDIDPAGGPTPYTIPADVTPPVPPGPPTTPPTVPPEVPPTLPPVTTPPTPPTVVPPVVPVVPPTIPPVLPPTVPPEVPPTPPPVVPPTVPPSVPPPAIRYTAVGAGVGGGPRVLVLNPDGLVVRDFFAYDPSFRGGVTVTTGDVNGDGVDDIITGAGFGGGPHVRVFDGRDGAELASFFAFDAAFRGGLSLTAADVDGDGRTEIMTGAGVGGGPHVKMFDGTGRELRGWFAYDATRRGGVSVAVGDVDGDGRLELVTGTGPGGIAEVKVFDAATGEIEAAFPAYGTAFTGGVFVAVGDVAGVGRDQIVTGAGVGGGPHVKLFDATGRLLAEDMVYPATFLGGVRVAVAKAAGASPETLTVGPATGSQPVRRLTGLGFEPIDELDAFEPTFLGGITV